MEELNKNKTEVPKLSQEEWSSLLIKEKEDIKQRAISEGTFMKAPNGMESKLTEGQWLTVRTQAFKDWFGDWENDPKNSSKVIDQNGEPRVMYHATFKDFDIPPNASRAEFGEGFYVGGKLKEFSVFVGHLSAQGEPVFPEGVTIMPLFINIRKPESFKHHFDKNIFDHLFKIINTLKSPYDGVIIEKYDYFVVPRPEQVKSAVGNNGRFNKNNPSVLE